MAELRRSLAAALEPVSASVPSVVLAGAGLGLVAAGLVAPSAAIALLGALVPLALGLGLRRGAVFLAALFAVAGFAGGTARLAAIDHTELAPRAGQVVSAVGYLTAKPRSAGFSRMARVRATAIGGAGSLDGPGSAAEPGLAAEPGPEWSRISESVLVRTAAAFHWPPGQVGDELRIEGELTLPRNAAGGEFDWVGYLRRQGIHVELKATSIRATGGRRGGLTGFVDRVRGRAEAALIRGLPPSLAALARGMVLGEDEAIPVQMRADFRRTGLLHLLAVSGQNVALLAVFTTAALALLGLGIRGRTVGVLAVIGLYVPLTGAGPSILRAGAMGAAAAVACLTGRLRSRWHALLVALTFTLALEPRAWRDVGWQLSFAAVVAIFLLSGPIAGALHRLPRPVAEAVALTTAATLGTAPLVAYQFGFVSLVGLLANLLAAPVVGPIMWLGTLVAAIGQVWLWPAALVNSVSELCLSYLAQVARGTSALPGAAAPVRIGGPLALLALYMALAAAALLGRHLASRWRAGGATRGRPARWAIAGAIAVLTLAGLTIVGPPQPAADGPSPPSLKVSFIDVGQGDATLIQTPEGGAVLVDGGPPGDGIAGKLEHAGVARLDAVVLTHGQLDHYGGLADVVGRFPVGLFLNGAGGRNVMSLPPEARSLGAQLRQRGLRVTRPVAGDRLRLGRLVLRVLWPPADRLASIAKLDPNQSALVLLASYADFDLLLTADAESDVLGALELPEVEALKVAHHGSDDPGLRSLLERLQPQIAAIEVGEANPYGHPSPKTLATLGSSVPRVYRTDRDGTVVATLDHGSLEVTAQN